MRFPMTTSEIVALIASIFTAISGISAATACILTYRTTRPKIKLSPSTKQSNRFYTFGHNKSFAVLDFEIINSSSIEGMVYNLCIVYEGKKYFAEDTPTNFDPYPFAIKSFFDDKIEQDIQSIHRKFPIKSPGYSVIRGFVFFPTFPVVQTSNITVDIRYRLTNSKFNRIIRRVKFALMAPEIVHTSK